jgi:hypothetical protein
MRRKLRTYEQLEHELDLAILHQGGASASDVDPRAVMSEPYVTQLRGVDNVLTSLGAALPTSNKRRYAH